MPSTYEALKVQNLIRTYRANPMMFTDDQLDELERLSKENFIKFKRIESDFSMRRALQQAQAGFLEGLTTFNLVPKEPRNTGEAIFRQLGHLSGFAPGILKAPVVGFAKLSAKALGRDIKKDGYGGITQAVLNGIDRVDAISMPMMASRGTKRLFDKGLKKTGLESLEYFKEGAKTKAIAEEALGLASASAVSNVWKGSDAIIDSYIHGAIYGGAFGGIGNFVSVGKLYNGTPQQIDQANKYLRAGVASMMMGLPTTLRGEPTEIQIYEYLLGGFFGYNTRPSHEQASHKWFSNPERYSKGHGHADILDPESSKDWGRYSKRTHDFILNEHPASSFKNSLKWEGATGSALGYLEHHFPKTNWIKRGTDHLAKHKPKHNENDLKRYIRKEARNQYEIKVASDIINAIVKTKDIESPQNDDWMDPVEIRREKIMHMADNLYQESSKETKSKYKNLTAFVDAMEGAKKSSIVDGVPNVERFASSMKAILGEKLFEKQEQRLRSHYNKDVEPLREAYYVEFDGFNARLKLAKGKQIKDTTIGEKYNELPINHLGVGGFRFLTHGVDAEGNPFRILKQNIGKEETLYTSLDWKDLSLLNDALAEKNLYIHSGVKDKQFLVVGNLIDEIGGKQYSAKEIIDLMSMGNEKIREPMHRSFEESQKLSEDPLLHERIWVSNILHDAINNNLMEPNGNLGNISKLMSPGYGRSVADYNKRVQLLVNRMTPVVKESFSTVIPDGRLRFIIANDEHMLYKDGKLRPGYGGVSDTDGGMIFRSDVFDAALKGVGLDTSAGHFKPVLVGKSINGVLATKSNGQRANEVWDKYMRDRGIHTVIFDSSAKLRGEYKDSLLSYNSSWIKTKKGQERLQYELFPREENIYDLPIENLQLSLGVFESPRKQTSGQEMAIQAYGQANEFQAPGFKEAWFAEVLEPSLAGSERGRNLVDAHLKSIEGKTGKEKDVEIDAFVKLFESNDLALMELPLDFVVDHILSNKTPKLTSLFMDKLNKLDRQGFFETEFEFDSDSDYQRFHSVNSQISKLMQGQYITRNTIFKDNWHNNLKKYLVRRYSNPFIESGGKAWLKAFTIDQMSYVDIDPAKKNRNLEPGEIYLDNAFKKLPVKFHGKKMTLGELWNSYKDAHKNGFPNVKKKTYENALKLMVIRTPADSMSGTRILKFKGFTEQRGAGAFTHHKDNSYLGGADKDSDYIKLFQGFSDNFYKQYEKVSKERQHLEQVNPYDSLGRKKRNYKEILKNNERIKKYNDHLDDVYHEIKDAKERQRYMGADRGSKLEDQIFYRTFRYSPYYRHMAALRSSGGQSGLGYGLNAKIIIQNWGDYVKSRGGTYEFEYIHPKKMEPVVVQLSLNKDKIHGHSSEQYFRDLGFMVVNKSADASNDPTIIEYPKTRRILFDALFKVKVIDKKTGEIIGDNKNFNYKEVVDWGSDTPLGSIKDAINLAKPKSKTKKLNFKKIEPFVDPKDLYRFSVPNEYADMLGFKIGERMNTTIDNTEYTVRYLGKKPTKVFIKLSPDKKSKIYGEEIRPTYEIRRRTASDVMSLFDMAHGVSHVVGKTKGDKALKSTIPQIVHKMHQSGIKMENLNFPNLKEIYNNVYDMLPVKLSEGGKLAEYSEKEIRNFVEKNLNILTEDMLINSANHLRNRLKVNDIDYILDQYGKVYGQLATIELLNKNFLNIYRDLDKRGIKGNITKELIPQIYEMNKKIKQLARERSEDIDVEIEIGNQKLQAMALKYKIDSQPLLEYYHTLLLSPITGLRQKTPGDYPEIQYNKSIHGSDNISFITKRKFYEGVEDFYNRAKEAPDMPVSLNVKVIDDVVERVPDAKVLNYENGDIIHLKEKIEGFNFKDLDKEIEWEQGFVGDKKIKEPRLTAYYGDKGTEYVYSKKTNVPKEWTPMLLEIKRQVEDITGVKFNSVLVNKYRNEKDSIGFHKDNEPELGKNPVIVSLSFGDTVNFKLKRGGRILNIPLSDKDILIMQGETQNNWYHGIEKGTEPRGQRINLTFRRTNLEKQEDIKIPVDLFESSKNKEIFREINDVINSNTLDLMAVNNNQVKEIKEFKQFLKDHPFIANNFNEWFKFFTSELSGSGVPRSATDFQLKDVIAINRFMKSYHDPKDLTFKLKYWHLDPRFIDQEMAMKGMINRYQVYFAKVKHGNKTLKDEPVYKFMSPIGSISDKVLQSERGRSKHRNFAESDWKPIRDFLQKHSDRKYKREALFQEVIKYREEGLESPSKDVLKLNDLLTDFFKKAGERWSWTYDRQGLKVSNKQGEWFMDDNFNAWHKETGGILNKYMRWNKDGTFDLKHFRNQVIDKDFSKQDIIDSVGIDGLKRYQYELRMMDYLASTSKKDPKIDTTKFIMNYRSGKRRYKGAGEINPEDYFPHINFGVTEGAKREFADSVKLESMRVWKEVFEATGSREKADDARDRFMTIMERKAQFSLEYFNIRDLFNEGGKIRDENLDADLERIGFKSKVGPLEARVLDLKGYDKRSQVITDYLDKLINGWYKNVVSIHGDYEIRNMQHRMRDYKPSKKEVAHFKKSKRYDNYVDVWSDYVKLYLQSILGHQSYFPQEILDDISKNSIDPLFLKDKRNLYYMTSDQNLVNLYEKLWQSGKWEHAPFVGSTLKDAPKDVEARKEYFSRKIHNFGRMEAQYELMTLLANTGTWATNIFGGTTMTIGSAGLRNFANSFNNKIIFERLLSDAEGNPVIKLYNGKSVKNKNDLHEWLKERGVIDNFIQNEFEYNEPLKTGLGKAGVNIKDFQRDITRAIKSDKRTRDESVMDVINKYGVKDTMLKYGSFFMQHSERVNRLNAFIAHGLQAVEKFGPEGRDLHIGDDYVFNMALKGIENTQFLYQNAQRPAFMRTATGKVLARFKLFVWNAVRVRKEFYKQAKLYDFKPGSQEYERFKDMFIIDMFMATLGGAFMFSIFDTALSPPLDWVQALADWLYGDKNERDMAFFGSKLGPANLLKPPIARIPESLIELQMGDWEKFSSYSVYTMFPFGRAVRQAKQIAERPERVGEVLLRLPVNKVQSRLERAKRRARQFEEIEGLLGEA